MSVGTSTAASIPFVVRNIQRAEPRSILDVGCGSGRWGCLAREFLEYWPHRFDPSDWVTRIVGVDIHEANWNPVQRYVYDECVTEDIRYYDPRETFDLVIATDVLEHIPKVDAELVLKKLLLWGRELVVGVPLGPEWARGGSAENPHEAHVSAWEADDFYGRHLVTFEVLVTEDRLPYGCFLLRPR